MIYSLFESLLEAIDKILSQGKFSWGAVITALLFFNKIQRNKEFRLRDQRVERNQQRIMAKLGVEGEWASDSRQSGLKQILQKLIYYLRKVMKRPNKQRRKNMIAKILKANLSKKLISALVSIGIATLNSKYGWNIPEELIWGILGLSATHISLQTIIDSIKAHAIAQVATTVADIKSIDVSNISYNDMIPYINSVNTALTQCFQDMKSGRMNDATKDAMALYLKVHELIEANKTPIDIPSATGIGA
jgi:hypothetical protein